MKTQTLKVYQADGEGQMRPRNKLETKIDAPDLDMAMDEARKILREAGLTRIRSLNAAPDNVLIAYCEAPEMTVQKVGDLEIRRPAKMRPKELG